MGGGHHGQQQQRSHHEPTAPPAVLPFSVSLDELYTGTTKKLKVSRKRLVLNTATGTYTPSDVSTILTIDVKPGWKEGTKIKFAREGDELSPNVFQDIEFVLKEKPHEYFKREGNDLVVCITIPLIQALTGYKKTITLLNGKKISISNNFLPSPRHVERLPGRGMPDQKNPDIKGDLLLKFDVQFPGELSDEKKEMLKTIL